MNKIDCEIIRDLMPLYSDGVCSESSRQLVEKHCAECGECKKKLTAMSAPLPEGEKAGKAQNPLKKTKRHYLKLVLLTAAAAVPAAAVICGLCVLTVNEQNRSRGITWSSLSAKSEMKDFASKLKRGKYEAALSEVGFRGLDNISRKNEGGLLEIYTKIFSDFFSECPIRSYECDASYYGAVMKGELNIYLDEKYTEGVPFSVSVLFERDDSGDCWITQTGLECYASSEKYDGKDDYIRETRRKLPSNVTLYPGDAVRSETEAFLKSDSSVRPGSVMIFTEKFKELYNEQNEFFENYRGENGFVDTESEEYKTEESRIGNKFAEYRKYYSEEIKRLFSEDYRLISVDGEEPYFCDEVYLDGCVFAEGKGCFKQKLTLNMETTDGESFWASFSSRVKYAADIPQDISFSENAPEEFKEDFIKLFTEKF